MEDEDICLDCTCYDFIREQCTMPSVDKIYACPLVSKDYVIEEGED